MTSDSTPVFALEKEALKTEIETGLQVGVDHLEDKPMKRKPVEKYHNTRYLLKQYRKVAYAIQISESDMNVRMEMEHGTRLSTLEVNAELAGVDLSTHGHTEQEYAPDHQKRAEHGKAGSGSWGVDVPDPLSHLLLGEEAGQP